nr:MAG TPA: hypothetical protein [Caudoviricetes sp.]
MQTYSLLLCPKVKRSKELDSMMPNNPSVSQSTMTTFSYNFMQVAK